MTTQEILEAARGAKTAVALSDNGTRDSALLGMADALCAPESMDAILAANAEDMAAAKGHISDVMLDRLALTPQRIEAMAKGIRDVAALPDPVGRVLSHIERPNGLVIEKTADGRHRHHLREPPQRHQRRCRPRHQERQCLHPPLRQRGVALGQRHRDHPAAGPAGKRSA